MKPNRYSYDIQSDVEELVIHSGLDIGTLKGKCIFITGGTGFFGVWLANALLHIKKCLGGDLDIIMLTRSPEKFIKLYPQFDFEKYVEFIRGDVKDFRLEKKRISHLIHMATTNASETYAGENQFNKLEMLYQGTKNVLCQCKGHLENVLFTSSGVAYGRIVNEKTSESDLGGPDTLEAGSALSLGKLVAEYLISHYAREQGYKFSIARCFTFAGQYLPLDLHYAFGNFVRNVLEHEDIIIRGDGQDRRSFLYIGDAIAWLLRLLVEPKNDIYNVGSEASFSIKEIASKVAMYSIKPVNIKILRENRGEGNFKRTSYLPSTSKIKSSYPGLNEWTTIDEIIKRMISVN